MKNKSIELAKELFHTTQPEVEKLVTDVLVKHALNRNIVLATTYLMEQIQTYRGGCPKRRVRKFRPCWVSCLKCLRECGGEEKFVHRRDFMIIREDDFSIMQYWELIEGNKRGFWKLTKKGCDFLDNLLFIPDSMIQCGVRDGRYKTNPSAHIICIDDVDYPADY